MDSVLTIVVKPPSTTSPIGIEFEFHRVNVIMGANGVGKSTILRNLSNDFTLNNKVKYIEGGRVIRISHLGDHSEILSTHAKAEHNYRGQRGRNLQNRLFAALVRLEKKQDQLKIKYAEDVHRWNLSDRSTEMPEYPTPPLDRVFQKFGEIFPEIELYLDGPNKNLLCRKTGLAPYDASRMSDGEKQVFGIISDLIETDDDIAAIIVDEPELNLNPQLALNLWDMLENELEDKIFIYATHNLSFALRKNVEKLFIITKTTDSLSVSHSFADLSDENSKLFLGSIPSVVVTKNPILIEGSNTSFDNSFYQWVIGDAIKFSLFPEGSCQDILGTMARKDLWSKLAPNTHIKGIIDRDFKSSLSVKGITEDNPSLMILKYHEAESYFCHPDFVSALSTASGNLEKPVSKETCDEKIYSFSKQYLARVSLTRSIEINNPFGLEKKLYKDINDTDNMREFIQTYCSKKETDENKVSAFMDIFEKQVTRIQTAIDSQDIEKLLIFMPGKKLLNEIVTLLEFKSEQTMLNLTRTHLLVEDFPYLLELRDSIVSLIQIEQ